MAAIHVQWITWPDAPTKGDAVDFFAAGHTLDDLDALITSQPRLCDADAALRRHDEDGDAQEQPWEPGVLLSEVADRQVEWLWENYIALGKINVGDGDPGEGKTLVYAADMAARLTTGRAMPDGSPGLGTPVGVVVFTAEDDPADTLGPRFDAAGGDRTRMLVVTTVPLLDDEGLPTSKERQPSFYDLDIIRKAVARVQAKLVIFDPFMAYLPSEAKSISDQDVRGVLAPLARLAGELHIALLLIRHLNKGNSGNVLYRGGGSIGIIGAARVGLLIARDPNDDTRHILAVSKSNLGPKPKALAYTIEQNENNIAVVCWHGACDYTASDLLHLPSASESDTKLERACDFLREVLADAPLPETRIQTFAEANNISTATLRRAKKIVGVESKKEGIGAGSDWVWRLDRAPESKGAQDAQNDVKHAHTTPHEHLWTNTGSKGAQEAARSKGAQPDGNEHVCRVTGGAHEYSLQRDAQGRRVCIECEEPMPMGA